MLAISYFWERNVVSTRGIFNSLIAMISYNTDLAEIMFTNQRIVIIKSLSERLRNLLSQTNN